jgi:hypothetical protein
MKVNNKNITVKPLFKSYKKDNCVYSSIEDSEVVLVFERNNAGLKKLSKISELLGFGLFPSFRILENRKHDVSKTESASVLKSGGRHLLSWVP